jgi:Mrp family chromosome partitioning ATPase
MSRMFNMLSGAVASRPEAFPPAGPRPAVAAVPESRTDEEDDAGFAAGIDDAPFVEVGGPGGPVFSAGLAAATIPKPALPPERKAAAAEAAIEIAPIPAPPPAAREFPRLAGAQRYVGVTFHDLSGKTSTRASIDGPDLGLVALHLPDHPVSGEYRTLRDAIRAQFTESAPRVLLFAAPSPEAGTTSVILNLAVSLAREEAPRVLVIDANIGRPAVARMLAAKPAPGLAEVLAQQVPLTWALQPTVLGNLEVLAAGAVSDTTVATLGEDLPRLIEQLRGWYDWVLIDGGVWGVVAERDGICPSADAVYLVTREADAGRPEFTSLRGWVKQLGGLLRGFISTRV